MSERWAVIDTAGGNQLIGTASAPRDWVPTDPLPAHPEAPAKRWHYITAADATLIQQQRNDGRPGIQLREPLPGAPLEPIPDTRERLRVLPRVSNMVKGATGQTVTVAVVNELGNVRTGFTGPVMAILDYHGRAEFFRIVFTPSDNGSKTVDILTNRAGSISGISDAGTAWHNDWEIRVAHTEFGE